MRRAEQALTSFRSVGELPPSPEVLAVGAATKAHTSPHNRFQLFRRISTVKVKETENKTFQ